MRIHVALTPNDPAPAEATIVVDTIRATTTICQAIASGYQRVICVGEVADALAEARLIGAGAVLGGERHGTRIDGFDLGNSPAEYLEPRGSVLVLTTTNGTRAILQAAAESEHVLVGSLGCLAEVAARAALLARSGDLAIRCAGVRGEVALDDVYVAGRLVEALTALLPGVFVTDAARTARAVARAYPAALGALVDSQSARDLDGTGLEPDVARCARESHLDVAPCVTEVAPGRVVVTR